MPEEIKEPSYNKPAIKRMVEGANGQTIYNDMQDPNSNRDPYARSRDLVYSMKIMLPQLLDDLISENMSPTVNDKAGKSGFSNHRLLEGFNSLVDTINSFVGKGKSHINQTLDDAAKENGYADLEPELKLIMEACLGRLYLSAFFFAARSLTPIGELPMADIGYGKTFDFVSNEVKMALDGVETPYAKKIKENARKESY